MPRKRRIDHRRRRTFSQLHVETLCTGHDYFGSFASDDERREAWDELGPAILDAWRELNPGTRPDAWWTHDAPERRRCINGVHPFDDPAHRERAAAIKAEFPAGLDLLALWQGKPRYCGKDQFDLRYETQADYLDRLDLLTDGERAALAVESPGGKTHIFIPALFDSPRRAAIADNESNFQPIQETIE